jgi:hypothetical protein
MSSFFPCQRAFLKEKQAFFEDILRHFPPPSLPMAVIPYKIVKLAKCRNENFPPLSAAFPALSNGVAPLKRGQGLMSTTGRTCFPPLRSIERDDDEDGERGNPGNEKGFSSAGANFPLPPFLRRDKTATNVAFSDGGGDRVLRWEENEFCTFSCQHISAPMSSGGSRQPMYFSSSPFLFPSLCFFVHSIIAGATNAVGGDGVGGARRWWCTASNNTRWSKECRRRFSPFLLGCRRLSFP